MATPTIAPGAASDVSEGTLKLAPARVLTFLQAVAEPAIRIRFAPLGWSDERAEEAWSLVEELKAATLTGPMPGADPMALALATCEEWEATAFVRARAMLQLGYPEQAHFLFGDRETSRASAAVVINLWTFLTRVDLLRKGKGREATRLADREALAVLARSGHDAATLERLGLAARIAQGRVVEEINARIVPEDERKRRHVEALRRMHAWISTWTELARTLDLRRDQLIRLGMAKRRVKKKGAALAAGA